MTIKVYPLKVSHFFFNNYCYLIIHLQTKEAVLIDPDLDVHFIKMPFVTALLLKVATRLQDPS